MMLSHWNHLNQLFNDLETYARQDVDTGKRSRKRHPQPQSDWTSTDIHEGSEALIVTMDVPGLTSDDIEVSVEEHILTISGQRERPEQPEGTQHRSGRRFGGFNRRFRLGAALEPNGTHAQVADGVLTVTVPKLPERQPHRVEVH
jgi:HSP20 family protein